MVCLDLASKRSAFLKCCTRPGALARCAWLVFVCLWRLRLLLDSSFLSNQLEPVWSRRCGRALSRTDTRTRTHTERAPPMGPPPTHVCLVRLTRLLPPKAGRLASRSAKPTLDGSSLITGSLIDRLHAGTVFGGMGTTDTPTTVQVPLASNASSTPDAEHRKFQEYCCALLNSSPYTRDGDVGK